MHIVIPPTSRARAVAAALFLLPLLACGRGDAGRSADADSATAAPAQGDTSAVGIARQVLGESVAMAIPFQLPGRDRRFVAVALPVPREIDDPGRPGTRVAAGGHEVVVMELRGDGHAIQKPGLYASREPFLSGSAAPADSAALRRMMGVEDANGDGDPEVWAAQYTPGSIAHTWDVRAYDRGGPVMHQLVARATPGAALDSTAFQFSESVGQDPALRRWLAAKARDLEAQRVAAAGGAGPRP